MSPDAKGTTQSCFVKKEIGRPPRSEGEGPNGEMHLDGAESDLSSRQRVSAPRRSQPWEREEGNLHPKTVSVTLGD